MERGEASINLIKPKTRKGQRIQKGREPQLVESSKKILLLHGNRPSKIGKELLTDIHRLRPRETVRLSRKNEDAKPFEPGGEVTLEHFSKKADCGQFVLANHSKKRPHNLVIGRFYDHRLYDLLELCVDHYVPLQAFGAASSHVQTDNKPCFIFAGEQFEHDPELKQAKSMLVDLFCGQLVSGIDLLGIGHVIFVTAMERQIILRQYAIKLKKSGTKVPRIELKEMGPVLDMTIRRSRHPNGATEKEALKAAIIAKKKEKNVDVDPLDGRIGRMYMPQQQLESLPSATFKGRKRTRNNEEVPRTKTPKLA